ncbi:PilZ domain protein [Poriferisphaera corsica]|uniref:PilZ domain protein n=1 Tax=Poriferisphaera corsica TaxID=2528020 RepID=A0A517YYU7_9BACT|nr:PilZ domain-containing protein [Poriferisphaera corsica]QDU35403.1 PilZ domain protein [Poriferisphaera corsica]
MPATELGAHMTVEDAVMCVISCARDQQYGQEENQRQHHRVSLQVPVEIGTCIMKDGKPADFKPVSRAWAIDISEGGLGLLVDQQWQVCEDEMVWVNFRALIPHATCQCAGILPILPLYCVKVLRNTFRLGCRFELDKQRILSRMNYRQ